MALPTTVPSVNDQYANQALLQQILDLLNDLDLDDTAVEDVLAFQQNLPHRLKSAVIDGGAADAGLTVTGITAAEDTLISVVRFDVAADTGTDATGDKVQAVTDVTSEASITDDDEVTLDTTNTTGDSLLVVWYDADGAAP